MVISYTDVNHGIADNDLITLTELELITMAEMIMLTAVIMALLAIMAMVIMTLIEAYIAVADLVSESTIWIEHKQWQAVRKACRKSRLS